MFGSIPAKRSFKNSRGTLAQYAYVPTETATHRSEASGIATAVVTTYDLVGELEDGQGNPRWRCRGRGVYVMHFAKPLGCEVQASASGKNEGSEEFGR